MAHHYTHLSRITIAVLCGFIIASSGISAGSVAASLSTHQASSASGQDVKAELNHSDPNTILPGENPSKKLSSGVARRIEQKSEQTTTGSGTIATTSSVDQGQITIRIVATGNQSSPVETLVNEVDGAVNVAFNGAVVATVPIDSVSLLRRSDNVGYIELPERGTSTDIVSEGVTDIDANDVHTGGVTGNGVTVAVIDTGFNSTNPEIRENIVRTENITGGEFKTRTGAHGTASAEVVTDTAPNVSLVLISAPNLFQTSLEKAIDFADEETSADIISFSIGSLTGPFDGTSGIDDEIAEASQNGTQTFVSAGNAADGNHLNTTFSDSDDDDFHNFNGSDELLKIRRDSQSDDIGVFVSWNDYPDSSENFDIELYDSERDRIAVSNNVQNGSGSFPPEEGIALSTFPENSTPPYSLAIRSTDTTRSVEFNIFTIDSNTLEYNTSQQSVTSPATEETAIAVGAVRSGTRQLESFSSRGPTVDGRRKPDIVAPDGVSTNTAEFDPYFGTSAAAPHAAGVGALIIAANSSLNREQAIRTVTETSSASIVNSATRSVDSAGANNQTGFGLIDASAAVDAVRGNPNTLQDDISSADLNGSGTQTDPYQISNISELQAIESGLSANYTLIADMNASHITQFDPIGDRFLRFNGSLTGQSYIISGLTINESSENRVGLFGATGNQATIKNVSLKNISVTGASAVGGLVGENSGNIHNTAVTGQLNGSNATGGLVGFASDESTIQDTTASASVSGSNAVGGLVGNNHGGIQDTKADGTITGSGEFNVGGLVGFADDESRIKNATATGNVVGPDAVGGLIGQSEGAVQNVTASGNINGSNATGGLIGFVDDNSTIRNATASGNVTGQSDVGGLTGGNSGTIQNAIALGDVTGSRFVGGLAGGNVGTIRRTIAVGSVTGTTDVGGVVGNNSRDENEGTVEDSYWDTVATGQKTSAGNATGLTTAEMQGQASRSNMGRLAFGTVWQPQSDAYPVLTARQLQTDSAQPPASVVFTNQTVLNRSTTLSVDSAQFGNQSFPAEKFVVAVHRMTADGNIGAAVGESQILSNGTRQNISVDLSVTFADSDSLSRLTNSETFLAVLHEARTGDGDNINHGERITRDGSPVIERARVNVVDPAQPSVRNLDIGTQSTDVEITQGTDVNIVATINNSGDVTGEFRPKLTVGNTTRIKNVTVDPATPSAIVFSNVTDTLSTGEFVITISTEAESVSQNLTVSSSPTPISVQLDNKTVPNGSTTVVINKTRFKSQSATTNEFVVVIHQTNTTRFSGGTGTKIGESGIIANGTQSNIVVDISQSVSENDSTSRLTESQTLVAMLHSVNTSGNTTHGDQIIQNGSPITDRAQITIEPQAQPIETETGTENDGFGPLTAIIALICLSILAGLHSRHRE